MAERHKPAPHRGRKLIRIEWAMPEIVELVSQTRHVASLIILNVNGDVHAAPNLVTLLCEIEQKRNPQRTNWRSRGIYSPTFPMEWHERPAAESSKTYEIAPATVGITKETIDFDFEYVLPHGHCDTLLSEAFHSIHGAIDDAIKRLGIDRIRTALIPLSSADLNEFLGKISRVARSMPSITRLNEAAAMLEREVSKLPTFELEERSGGPVSAFVEARERFCPINYAVELDLPFDTHTRILCLEGDARFTAAKQEAERIAAEHPCNPPADSWHRVEKSEERIGFGTFAGVGELAGVGRFTTTLTADGANIARADEARRFFRKLAAAALAASPSVKRNSGDSPEIDWLRYLFGRAGSRGQLCEVHTTVDSPVWIRRSVTLPYGLWIESIAALRELSEGHKPNGPPAAADELQRPTRKKRGPKRDELLEEIGKWAAGQFQLDPILGANPKKFAILSKRLRMNKRLGPAAAKAWGEDAIRRRNGIKDAFHRSKKSG